MHICVSEYCFKTGLKNCEPIWVEVEVNMFPMSCYSWHNMTKYIYFFFLVLQNDLKLHILKYTVNTRGQSD